MAREIDVLSLSFKAENNLSTKQYYAVELSAADQVDVCDGAGDVVIGILQNKPVAGRAAAVRILGVSKWISDGVTPSSISVGDFVGTNATGQAIKKSTANDLVRGIALSGSSAVGTVIDVLLITLRIHA